MEGPLFSCEVGGGWEEQRRKAVCLLLEERNLEEKHRLERTRHSIFPPASPGLPHLCGKLCLHLRDENGQTANVREPSSVLLGLRLGQQPWG